MFLCVSLNLCEDVFVLTSQAEGKRLMPATAISRPKSEIKVLFNMKRFILHLLGLNVYQVRVC